VQLVAVSALLADFELWPGRSALRRAVAEPTDDGLGVRLPTLPIPLSRIWSKLGGGDPAAERTRAAVLGTIADVTNIEPENFSHGGLETGFFLDSALAKLLDELDRPLDGATARSLWMWRWSLPPCPEIGDTTLLAVPDQVVAERLGAAMWAAAVRRGESATLGIVGPGQAVELVAESPGNGFVQVLAGTFDEGTLASIMDRTGTCDRCTVALGRFPDGWKGAPAPVFDAERLAVHLTVTGISPARRVRLIDGQTGRFDPFSRADRRSLTESAAQLFSGPRRRMGGRYRELVRVAALAPDGVRVDRVLELAGVGEGDLDAARDARAVILRRGYVLVPESVPMKVDPCHAELVESFDGGDPRRLIHGALATGNTGDLLAWTRERLDDLDAVGVRRLLSGLDTGALGPGVQVALAEACLSLADIHGARRALAGLSDEIARPWSSWLRLMDRSPEFEVEFPRPIDIRHAPRACAEIALVSVRRALWWHSESAEEPLNLVRDALPGLNGVAQRWVEIKLTALVDPDKLADAEWRRTATGGHPELTGLILFEISLRATFEGQFKLAKSLLRRVMSAERAPGRMAFMQLNLGGLEADDGHHKVAEALTLGAFRLFQAAGFRHRLWDALHNLAVMDIDQLRVDRASARLDAVGEGEHTLFVEVERARLALAIGDLDSFRSRLAELPAVEDLSSPQIVQALSFLYGVGALFFDSPVAAAPLLRAGGPEGLIWLDLAHAVAGLEKHQTGSSYDGWGIRRAAALVRGVRETPSVDDLDDLLPRSLDLKDALALALCRQLGVRPGWPGRHFRARAATVLVQNGLMGWAARVRWGSFEVEELLRGFSRLARNHGSDDQIEEAIEGVLSPLGLEGLVIRSAYGDRELWRVGTGEACAGEYRGSLEVVPLGSEPIRGSDWSLFGDLLELVIPSGGADEVKGESAEVRIDGISAAIVRLREEVRRNAGPRFTVLVHGETGSGKEIVAREIHRLSERKGELVSVNVAAIPANLLEAELFGSVKGAFTGAERSRRGLVTTADGGTLFLDEVGDLDVALQVKLLRFLESGEVRQVGSDRTNLLDVRVICATHRNLERRVREGRFREDLYYRIAFAKIQVPALRERLEDIPILTKIFEEEASHRHGLQMSSWTVAAERRLLNHRWPGNVRELKHTVEVAMARASGTTIRPEHLQLAEQRNASRGTWESALSGFKRRLLTDILTRHRGNRSAAARELGISRQALLYQLKKLKLREL
jgi:sigma-54-dependent transcriptional regulator